MKESLTTYNYLEEYMNKIRSRGRYSFTFEEAKNEFSVSEKALAQSIFRLKSKKKITQIRKGFYAIIPPEYSATGMLPVPMFIDDLMKSLNRNYYVGLLSAAALNGAAHQQPMEYFVVTENPSLRAIKNKKLKINFYVKKEWSPNDIEQMKTSSGYINVSTPELTALDLFTYLDKIGINRIVTIIAELKEEMKAKRLLDTAMRYTQTSSIQKLGFLLDQELDDSALANALLTVLEDRRHTLIPISSRKEKTGPSNDKWKIIKNTDIQNDL